MYPKPHIYSFWGFIVIILGCLISAGKCEDIPANRLIHESSPYLLKHATNPVNWYPWGDEAFSLAKEKNKPVLLSIGYLTCHWCNVMEEESFSDPVVAALINETFVPIKVDREERPDIDQIYMKACQILSPSCGWPLTVFLTPAGKPFYVGTYIPKENRFGKLGLLEIIPRVKQLWSEEHKSVLKSADSINSAIVSSTIQLPGGDIEAQQLDVAFQALAKDFDEEHGGFGRNSKFPKPLTLIYLLRYWHRTGNSQALAMVEKTLTTMRQGAIYDHLGYGFHRYTTDPIWRVPHFEKMLYDQALLVLVYIEAYQATAKEEYADTAREILEYVLKHMSAGSGAFYSAESADSEGEEGKFYLWSLEDIKNTLDREEAAAAVDFFHITDEGNFTDPVSGRKTGKNVLYTEQVIIQKDIFEKIRLQLLLKREKRQRPERDDKVLTDWNGLMIAALARAAMVLDQPEYGEAARKAALFILKNLRSDDGELLHRWRKGQAGLEGTAADYSFLTWGLLELYSWDFNSKWLGSAIGLTDDLLKGYWDAKLGGFYLTAAKKKSILPRIKESKDTALPSSNSVAMYNLLKLSRLTGNNEFEVKASKISRLMSSRVKGSEPAFPMLLTTLDLALAPSQEVVIVGEINTGDTSRMIQTLRNSYFPNAVVLFKPVGEKNPQINNYASYIAYMYAIDNKATAYVCTNFKCNFPTTDPTRMLDELSGISEKAQSK